MNKPKEDIKIIHTLIRDVKESIKHMEKGINERIDKLENKINDMGESNEKDRSGD